MNIGKFLAPNFPGRIHQHAFDGSAIGRIDFDKTKAALDTHALTSFGTPSLPVAGWTGERWSR